MPQSEGLKVHRAASALALAESGNDAARQGLYQEAAYLFRAALRFDPDNAPLYNNLGLSLSECGRQLEAFEAFSQALRLAPESPIIHNSMGNLCFLLYRMQEAIAHYQQAVRLDSTYVPPYINLGRAWRMCGDERRCLGMSQQAVELDPDNTAALENYLFSLNYFDMPPDWIAAEHVRLAPVAYGAETAVPVPEAEINRTVRIGFVSPDFKNHPVAQFMLPVLRALHRRLEIVCYAQVACPDTMTDQLRKVGCAWRSTVGMPDTVMAALIREDRIDILIDLAGVTEGNRLGVFARKPAPVQCTWLGYPNTTGLSQIDYRITDAVADPPGLTEQFHAEKLLRMPRSFIVFEPLESSSVAPLPEQDLTLCCFNNLAKVPDGLLVLWSEILRQLPEARLLLKYAFFSDPFVQELTISRLVRHRIDPQRVVMTGFTPAKAEHLGMYGRCHIALDTFPYNGTTTTCEALWMGVPVVTQAGRAHVSRVGASILSAMGCPELIASSGTDYIKKVVSLAQDRSRLRQYRAGLRDRMRLSPLMDVEAFAADLARLCRVIMKVRYSHE